ncbi:ATP-binding protein [Chlorogloeopsis sp. ULAP01]|uniref:ATP-binding protein n=1 Tax=Chlorogloeopsis sp. ULAP01 TaxID=3056483 RepID=UPI0025AA93C8|nr:ATP-binding protein [Chlorogloeopsis sp. ULAP01]MDM9385803.1 ATP-binding protein [Chlorogloeopsis sp. ULAP01]
MDSLTKGKKAALADVFAGGGEMGALMRSHDWANTSLGLIKNWPQSLKTLVSTILASRFPQAIYWGEDYIQFYNDALIPIYGAYHPHALGQPLRQTWTEVWDDQFSSMCEGVRNTGEVFFVKDQPQLVLRFGYLEEAYFTYCYSPARDETGKSRGIFATITETTQQVISQRRLTMLRELATAVSGGAKTLQSACLAAANTLNPYDIPFALFYWVDKQGIQAELVASTGLPADSIVPKTINLTEQEDVRSCPFVEVLQSHEPQMVTDVVERFGALPGVPWPESPHSALILPILGSNKEIVECLLVAGISPRLKFDSEYRTFLELVAQQVESSITTAQIYEQEHQRAEALTELDRVKTAFFNNISHEFRTPLTLMLNPLEQVIAQTQGSLQPEQREQLAIVQRNAMRLHKLVNTLLDFSRIEAGRIQAVYEPTDLAGFTAELASVFRSAIETAQMQLLIDCPPLSEPVYVDREMWEKIVLNLISNAFKFTFEGEIAVSLHQIGDKVELKIRDTGTGIKSENLPRIFERFHRIRGVKARSHEGSGIGLALVQELVHLHDGTIKVESVFGKGITFTVTLPTGSSHLPSEQITAERTLNSTSIGAAPYVQEALRWIPEGGTRERTRGQPDKETRGITNPQSRQSTQRGKPPHVAGSPIPRILLVDDNADMRDYLQRLLLERWQVTAVANGADALNAIAQQLPDLVLTDVMMPEVDGFQLLNALRADPKTKGMPIILLSARAGEEAAIEGLQAGADDYLIKPFSAQELIARVDSHLQIMRLRQEISSNCLKDEFLATVTHELHAPLAAILGWTRLLSSKTLDETTVLRALDTIERNAKNQAKLIEDLLDISTILSGKVCLAYQPVNLTDIIEEVINTTSTNAQAKRINIIKTLHITSTHGEICVLGDFLRLQQVVTKLLDNAIKFTPIEGSIKVRLDADDSWCSILISDTGIGIGADFLPRVFDRFTQAEVPSRHSPGGLGLGLAIALQLVQLHGGTIEAASDGIGRGAKFTVKLPLMISVESP